MRFLDVRRLLHKSGFPVRKQLPAGARGRRQVLPLLLIQAGILSIIFPIAVLRHDIRLVRQGPPRMTQAMLPGFKKNVIPPARPAG